MSRRGGQISGARLRPGHAIYEDIRPITEWKYGKEAHQPHFLLVQLPGFAREQIKVSIEGINTLRVQGECLIGGNKWNRFEEDFRIPDDCNIRGIRAKFESSTLTITMPKKGPTTTITQVSPRKEETQRAHLEAPLKVPDNEKGTAKIEQEVKEKTNSKVIEKVKESKKDEDAKEDSGKKAKEADEGSVKGIFKPESYFEKSEKKDEETSKEVKEKEDDKSKKVMERINIGKEIKGENKGVGKGKEQLYYFENTEKKTKDKIGEVEDKEIENSKKVMEGIIGMETKEKGLPKLENYFEKNEKIVKETRGELKEKVKEKYKEVLEGFNIGSKTNEDGKAIGYFKAEKYDENVKTKATEENNWKGKEKENVKEDYKEVMKSIAKGDLEEERQLMVNMGVAVLVIVALGVYITYGLGSYGKAKA